MGDLHTRAPSGVQVAALLRSHGFSLADSDSGTRGRVTCYRHPSGTWVKLRRGGPASHSVFTVTQIILAGENGLADAWLYVGPGWSLATIEALVLEAIEAAEGRA